MKNKIIAVDFDGTLCVNDYPMIGAPNFRLIEYLKQRQKDGAILILWTCRVGLKLWQAFKWCHDQDLNFDYINENADKTIKEFGTDCRKIFAHEYIDDRNMFAPEFCLPYIASSSNHDMTFDEFCKLYDCIILTNIDAISGRRSYEFRYNNTDLIWFYHVPYYDFIDVSHVELEHEICRQAKAALLKMDAK